VEECSSLCTQQEVHNKKYGFGGAIVQTKYKGVNGQFLPFKGWLGKKVGKGGPKGRHTAKNPIQIQNDLFESGSTAMTSTPTSQPCTIYSRLHPRMPVQVQINLKQV